jgi:hypothetical protein
LAWVLGLLVFRCCLCHCETRVLPLRKVQNCHLFRADKRNVRFTKRPNVTTFELALCGLISYKVSSKPLKIGSEARDAIPRKRITKSVALEAAEVSPETTQITVPEVAEMPVGMISHDRFLAKIQALRERETIRNDKDEDVPFDGETKDDFIRACEESYPVIERTLGSVYEMGSFLREVRDRLKPKKLYPTWLELTGIPQGTAQNYVQASERYSDRLPQFAHLGIKKLLIASRLKNCVEYVQKHEQAIAEQTAEELEKKVKALRGKRVAETGDGRGRRPMSMQVGPSRFARPWMVRN